MEIFEPEKATEPCVIGTVLFVRRVPEAAQYLLALLSYQEKRGQPLACHLCDDHIEKRLVDVSIVKVDNWFSGEDDEGLQVATFAFPICAFCSDMYDDEGLIEAVLSSNDFDVLTSERLETKEESNEPRVLH